MNSPFCQVAQIKNYLLDPFLSTDMYQVMAISHPTVG